MNELVSASEAKAPSRLRQFRGGLRAALRIALDVALPPLCPSCRAPLGDGVGLCASCWSKLSLIEPPYCARLGIPFTYDPGPGLLSMEAIADPRPMTVRAPQCAMTTFPARWCFPSNTATGSIWRP